ncbi:MAG: hypothetical protein HQ500_07110 [Flavobacteriales bacterium]|nr:hypothetical protein [Flavobacteriales bacterium]
MTYKRSLLHLATLSSMLVLVMEACVHESFVTPVPGECDPDTVYYEKDIQPILTTYCVTGCHDEVTAEEGVVLTSYARMVATTEPRAGEPDESDIYEVLIITVPEVRMPFEKPALSNENIALIRKWIEQGALNNTCNFDTVSIACGGIGISYSQDIKPILEGNGCVGCHSAGTVILANFEGVSTVAANGRLFGAVTHDSSYLAMPQGGAQIDSCSIETIKAWIDQGSLNN